MSAAIEGGGKKQDGDGGNATKPKSNAPESNNNKGKDGEAYEGGGSSARKATPEEAAKMTQIRKDFKISKNKNIAHVEGKIDGKLIDLKSYSGKDKRPGTVDPIGFVVCLSHTTSRSPLLIIFKPL